MTTIEVTVWVNVDTEQEAEGQGPTPIDLALRGASHKTLAEARDWAASYERPTPVTVSYTTG